MKFAAYDSSLRGYMYGWPTEYLNAIATSVGSLAIRRIAEMSRCVRVVQVHRIRIERRERADEAGQHRHRVRVAPEAAHEELHLLVDHRVVASRGLTKSSFCAAFGRSP